MVNKTYGSVPKKIGTKIYGRTDGNGRDVPETTTPCQRKQHFVQYKGKHSKSKEAYMDGSKSTGRKVGYAAVFTDSTRRGALPEEASIHTAEMTAMKEIKEREDIRWVIYTDSLSSMLAIKNRENHPILIGYMTY